MTLCACGCGQPTKIAPKNSTRRGHIKGQPYRWLHGHNHRKHPHDEPIAHRRRRQRYGLEPGDVERMLAEQNHLCANSRCGTSVDRSSPIDHDHLTGGIRGILCQPCNMALGQVADSIPRLLGLADYLEGFPSS